MIESLVVLQAPEDNDRLLILSNQILESSSKRLIIAESDNERKKISCELQPGFTTCFFLTIF
ncbi:MAG: hypothetical protein ABFQ62_02470 [Patescibacteria group bacterium]